MGRVHNSIQSSIQSSILNWALAMSIQSKAVFGYEYTEQYMYTEVYKAVLLRMGKEAMAIQ